MSAHMPVAHGFAQDPPLTELQTGPTTHRAADCAFSDVVSAWQVPIIYAFFPAFLSTYTHVYTHMFTHAWSHASPHEHACPHTFPHTRMSTHKIQQSKHSGEGTNSDQRSWREPPSQSELSQPQLK